MYKQKISKDNLYELYAVKKLSTYQIALLIGKHPNTIYYYLKKYNIQIRKNSDALKICIIRRNRSIAKAYKRERPCFQDTNIEKAYLIGFRIGDLNVSQKEYSKTITISTSTTKKEQIKLLHHLFDKYKKASFYKVGKQTNFILKVDQSFSFLIPKKDEIQKWILNNNEYTLSFLGGYIDAEGSFGIYKNRAEFSIASYEKNIIKQIAIMLTTQKIDINPPKITIHSGYTDKRGVITHKDVWRLKITKKSILLRFCILIKPYVKHPKRIQCIKSIIKHLKHTPLSE